MWECLRWGGNFNLCLCYNALDLRVVCDVYWAGIQDSYTCCWYSTLPPGTQHCHLFLCWRQDVHFGELDITLFNCVINQSSAFTITRLTKRDRSCKMLTFHGDDYKMVLSRWSIRIRFQHLNLPAISFHQDYLKCIWYLSMVLFKNGKAVLILWARYRHSLEWLRI
jgi:hypothetical protein